MTSTSRRREWRDLARKYGVFFASGVVTVIFRTPKTAFHVVSRTSSFCVYFFLQKGTYIIRIVLIVLLVILFILYICTHFIRFYPHKICMPNLFPVPPSKPEQKVLSRTTAVVWPVKGMMVFIQSLYIY